MARTLIEAQVKCWPSRLALVSAICEPINGPRLGHLNSRRKSFGFESNKVTTQSAREQSSAPAKERLCFSAMNCILVFDNLKASRQDVNCLMALMLVVRSQLKSAEVSTKLLPSKLDLCLCNMTTKVKVYDFVSYWLRRH